MPDEVESFLESLQVRKFYGVGKITTQKMYQLGIFTGADLKNKTLIFLEKHFKILHNIIIVFARGVHNSPVKPTKTRKSVGVEHTYSENLTSEIFILEKLDSNFTQTNRSKTTDKYICLKMDMYPLIKKLLYQQKLENSVRLLGISISNLDNEAPKNTKQYIQLKLNL